MIVLNVTAILKCFTHLFFYNVLLLPLQKVENQINQLQKDSLGKSNERTLD